MLCFMCNPALENINKPVNEQDFIGRKILDTDIGDSHIITDVLNIVSDATQGMILTYKDESNTIRQWIQALSPQKVL